MGSGNYLTISVQMSEHQKVYQLDNNIFKRFYFDIPKGSFGMFYGSFHKK